MKSKHENLSDFPYSSLAYISLVIGLIYAQFHLFGNTTEVEGFGRSAFNWMIALWKSARIFGGSVYYLGWIMPVIVMTLIYIRRRELVAVSRAVWWPGLAFVALALFLHWAGARAQQTRLSIIALILLMWSIPLFLYGWALARQLIFPAILLLFCVPLNFLDAITFPMRILSTQLAAILLNGIGIEATHAGSTLLSTVPHQFVLDGADSASSLGTLLLLIAGTAIVGYVWRDGMLPRILMMILVFPAFILAGAFRMLLLTLAAASINSDIALSLYHHGSFILFVAVYAGIFFLFRAFINFVIALANRS